MPDTTTVTLSEKALLKAIKGLQEDTEVRPMPCPRCGKDQMLPVLALNSLSRHEDVYVCGNCGTDEGLRNMCDVLPLPLQDWAIFKALYSGKEKP